MDEEFDLPVQYHGEELLLPSSLHVLGYTHRFHVKVGGAVLFFEPDEEGSYRALTDAGDLPSGIDAELLKAIADTIVAVLK